MLILARRPEVLQDLRHVGVGGDLREELVVEGDIGLLGGDAELARRGRGWPARAPRRT